MIDDAAQTGRQIPMERAPNQPLFLRIAQVVIVCLGVWMILATSAVLVLALLSGKPVFARSFAWEAAWSCSGTSWAAS